MKGYIRQLHERVAVIDKKYGGPARLFEDEKGRLVIDSVKGGWRFYFVPAPPDEEVAPDHAGSKGEPEGLAGDEEPVVPPAAKGRKKG